MSHLKDKLQAIEKRKTAVDDVYVFGNSRKEGGQLNYF